MSTRCYQLSSVQPVGHSWRRLLVLVIGLVVVGAGVAIIAGAVRKTFTKHLSLAQMSPRTRTVVETVGLVAAPRAGSSSVSLACSWSSPR